MARFRFRLQPVLEQRKREEEDRMRAVGELERRRLDLEARIRGCQGRIVAGREEIARALTSGRVDLGGARMQAGATMRDDQEARRGVLELAAVLKGLDHARRELAQAAARRRAMELLRDRDRERYMSELNRRETLALDDLVVMRHRGEA